MSKRPKAAPARTRIRNLLSRNLGIEFAAGSRIPSMRELADQLEAACGTVRWAVKDLISEGLLVSRPRSGIFVSADFTDDQLRQRGGCVLPSRNDRRVLSGRTIEIVYVDGPERFTSHISEAFENAVHGLGGICVKQHRFDTSAPRYDLRDFKAEILVCFNLDSEVLCRDDQTLIFAGTSRDYRVKRAVGYDVVSVDQEQGGALAGKMLKEAGHMTACFVGVMSDPRVPNRSYDPTSQARLAGFLHGWGGEEPVHRLYSDSYDATPAAALVAQYIKLNPRPEAVFAASDELAIGFVAGAAAHDLKAGYDYSIVGFDGQDIARTMAGGPLTTVEVPVSLLGQRAAKLLIERLNHPQLPPQRVFLGCSMFHGKTIMQPTQRS